MIKVRPELESSITNIPITSSKNNAMNPFDTEVISFPNKSHDSAQLSDEKSAI